MISDLTLRTLGASLHGLTLRRSAAENNLANIETPGFHAGTVDFEESLAKAIADGDPSRMDVEIGTSNAPTRLNGNNVNVDEEMVGLTETSLHQQLVIQAVNSKYTLLRTAITGQ